MKTRDLQANPRFYIILPATHYRTLHLPLVRLFGSPFNFLNKSLSFAGPKNRTTAKLFTLFGISGVCSRSGFSRFATDWAELMRRVLAPLRRIISRELEIYSTDRITGHPYSFVVHDTLECTHTYTSFGWDIFDLLNAYTESAHVRAVRHRCHECLTLTAKKPVQSVAAVAKAA